MPDIVTGKIFVDGEKGITATKLNQIQSLAIIQPSFYTAKPTTSSLDPTDTLLDLKSSGSYAQISGSQLISSISSQVNILPQIYSVRLRSFNSVGNPSFECDQISCGATVANVNGKYIDRWFVQKSGAMVVSAGQNVPASGNVCVPGTNFKISNAFYRITVTTAATSLGVNDFLQVASIIEGPVWRELSLDVHSIQLLVRSSVSGLQFGCVLQDSPGTKCLASLCTITSANTWTLINLPNLPVWPSGNFSASPGSPGYVLVIGLAAGTSLIAPANGTWQNGSFNGALGQSNFAATNGATFDIGFVQHEPGNVCTTLIDKPFTQNLDECTRCYCKSYPYTVAGGGTTFSGAIGNFIVANGSSANGGLQWPKRMARTPTVIGIYNPSSGAQNSTYRGDTGASLAVSVANYSDAGLMQLTGSGMPVGVPLAFQYTSDTGW